MQIRTTLRGAVAAGLVSCLALAATGASAAGEQIYRTAAELPDELLEQLPVTAEDAGLDFAPMLVKVNADRDQRNDVVSSGLDVTEHAGHDYVEVVVASAGELDVLDGLGLKYEVVEHDLINLEHRRIMADAAFARANPATALPSGRNTYRVLADYKVEIDQLAADNPGVAKAISLGSSFEGRDLNGIEITLDVDAEDDGRPVFLMFGNHHAREWPSAETPMEFAYTLLNDLNAGDARTTDLLGRLRVIIVPVSNPDGYEASRTSGDLVDLTGPLGTDGLNGTVVILATPGNAYKRKNCNTFTGQPFPPGGCTANPSPGGQGIGVDLNRNYGALWGGPGAVGQTPDPSQSVNGAGNLSALYRGDAPFSEPETQAIRTAISTNQVTTLISNHTFSNLLLRPVGVVPTTVGPDDLPIGFAPDECFATASGDDVGMKTLGEIMTAQTGYSNQFGWELYDTTGTTEDYSYNATGGYGYTFEIGPDEFHPPYENVVNEYTGNTAAAQDVTPANAAAKTTPTARVCEGDAHEHTIVGGGLAEAYYQAALNAANPATHSVITGEAPAGAVISVTRTGDFLLWDKSTLSDTVTTSMVVPAGDAFEYHVNPSTRPFNDSRAYLDPDAPDPVRAEVSSTTNSEIAPPNGSTDIELVITAGIESIHIDTELVAPTDDIDLELLAPDATELASSGGLPGEDEQIRYDRVGGLTPGTYLLRVVNYLGSGQHNTTISLGNFPGYEPPAELFSPRTPEQWTLTCELGGTVIDTQQVSVDRGESVNVGDLCVVAAGSISPTSGTGNGIGVDVAADGAEREGDLAATGGGATVLALVLLALAGLAARRRQDVAA